VRKRRVDQDAARNGAVYVTVTRRLVGNSKLADASGDVNARISMQLHRFCTSMKKLTLFF
jgi:hypothetical protein